MSDNKKTSIPRQRVLNALALFHRYDQICVCRPELPSKRVAFELCRLWLDHVFTPGLRYMDGFKGDRDAEAAQDFIDAFSDEEYSWLERFNRFLELRLDRLRPDERESGEFPDNDTWKGIVRDAGNLLDLIEGDPRTRSARLDLVAIQIEKGGHEFKGLLRS